MVVMHITFLIVEDVLNPIIGLDALHQNSVQFPLFQTGKAYLQQKSQKAVLHYHKHHYYASGLFLSGYVRSSILKWDDPQYTIFDPQSTSQIIAEINFEINSEARLTAANSITRRRRCQFRVSTASVSKNPGISHSSRKGSSLSDSYALQVMVHCMSACQRSASASQRKSKAHKRDSTRS